MDDKWPFTLAIGTLTATLGVAAYFIQKWIEGVDGSIKKLVEKTEITGEKISLLERAVVYQTKNISENYGNKLGTTGAERLEKIEKEITLIKSLHINHLLPATEEQKKAYGKIILVEARLEEQDGKMRKLFEVIKAIALRGKK